MNSNTGGVGDTYLNAPQLKHRYGGRSDMWIWRRLVDDPDFPKPFVMGKQRYWRLSELLAYEEKKRSVPHATA